MKGEPIRLRAILLDFDGLVLDTESACFGSWQWLFRQHGHEYALEDFLHIVGTDNGARDPRLLLEAACGRALDWPVLEASRRTEELRLGATLAVKPGVRELVEAAQVRGWGRAVVSSSSHAWVRGHLERHDLLPAFDTIVCRGDAPQVKPAPDLYLEAIQRLGVAANETVAFEDSHNGSLAAKRAGLWCVAVPNEITATQDFSHADLRVDSLAGLDLGALGVEVAKQKSRAR